MMQQNISMMNQPPVASQTMTQQTQMGQMAPQGMGQMNAASQQGMAQPVGSMPSQQGLMNQQQMGVAQQGLSMVPLYQQNMAAQRAAVGSMQFTPDEFSKFGTIGQAGGLAGSGQEFSNLDLKSVGGMNNKQFRQFKQNLTPEQQAMIFGTKQFTDAYKSVDTSAMNPFNLR